MDETVNEKSFFHSQCRGVDPWLHGKLRDPDPLFENFKWENFHNDLISDLDTILSKQLEPQGYSVDHGTGLQVRTYDSKERQWSRTRPLQSDGHIKSPTDRLSPSKPHGSRRQAMSLEDLAGGKESYEALKLYQPIQEQDQKMELAGWIEIISPCNTPTASKKDWLSYLSKRNALLEQGVPVIELSLGHLEQTTIPNQPVYPDEEDSHPYCVTVLDPRGMKPGQINITTYPFGVGEPIPSVNLELPGGAYADINFDKAYRKTYKEHWDHKMQMADYLAPPALYDTYSPEDQAQIDAQKQTFEYSLALTTQNPGFSLEM